MTKTNHFKFPVACNRKVTFFLTKEDNFTYFGQCKIGKLQNLGNGFS